VHTALAGPRCVSVPPCLRPIEEEDVTTDTTSSSSSSSPDENDDEMTNIMDVIAINNDAATQAVEPVQRSINEGIVIPR